MSWFKAIQERKKSQISTEEQQKFERDLGLNDAVANYGDLSTLSETDAEAESPFNDLPDYGERPDTTSPFNDLTDYGERPDNTSPFNDVINPRKAKAKALLSHEKQYYRASPQNRESVEEIADRELIEILKAKDNEKRKMQEDTNKLARNIKLYIKKNELKQNRVKSMHIDSCLITDKEKDTIITNSKIIRDIHTIMYNIFEKNKYCHQVKNISKLLDLIKLSERSIISLYLFSFKVIKEISTGLNYFMKN